MNHRDSLSPTNQSYHASPPADGNPSVTDAPVSYPVVRPARTRSALITNATRYKSAAGDDDGSVAFGNRSFCPFPPPEAARGSVVSREFEDDGDILATNERRHNVSFILPLNPKARAQMEETDPLNNYTFMVRPDSDIESDDADSATGTVNSNVTGTNGTNGTNSSFIAPTRATAIAEHLVRRREYGEPYGFNDNEDDEDEDEGDYLQRQGMPSPFTKSHSPDGEVLRPQPRVRFQVSETGSTSESQKIADEEIVEDHSRLPMPVNYRVRSMNNLDDDSVSFTALFQSLMSETPITSIFFALKVTLLAVFPMFLLTEHPNTKNYFVGGLLMPILAGLFVRQTFGMQMFMTALAVESCIVFILYGTVMNAVGTINNTSGWWCSVIFGCFVFGCFGDHPAKRLMMMYVVIIMQMEHMPSGDTIIFPSKFARDFLIATAASIVANVLPWPLFSTDITDELFVKLHMLYAAGVGNAMKGYFAPVQLDAKMAISQIPFVKIRGLTHMTKMQMHFSTYEPQGFFGQLRYRREERIAHLQRIRIFLYAMSSAAHQHVASVDLSKQHCRELKEFLAHMQKPAMELAGEVIDVLKRLGSAFTPDDVLGKINFDAMHNRIAILQDVIDRERMQMAFIKKLTRDQTNEFHSCLAFCNGIIDIANEVALIQTSCKENDTSKYPGFFMRVLNFFFLENWRDFWKVLFDMLALRSYKEVRIVKDSIRYTGAFAVACAFTLNYDHSKVYYFGMAILVRLAQQTAAETIAVGVYRICGLCIGASLGTLTIGKTHNLAERTLLTMTWVFVASCFSQHAVYGSGAQYVLVICITSQSLAYDPGLLMNRLTDNVFAFISYFIICELIFPVDPIRVLWNTRTKVFIKCNELVQSFVTLACAAITRSGEEVKHMIAEANKDLGVTQGLLFQYTDWAGKSATEPTLRGGVYPNAAVQRVLLFTSEVVALLEVMHHAVARLHRPRDHEPPQLIVDQMEVMRPFFLDAGKITFRLFQLLVDSTERALEWRLEDAILTLYRAKLAVQGARKLSGNMQRNFFLAVQQVSAAEKRSMNHYENASFVANQLRTEESAALDGMDTDELIQRICAMSFHMSNDKLLPRDDLQAFNTALNSFELMLKTLWQLLEPMVDIYEYERSRVTVVNPLSFIAPKFL